MRMLVISRQTVTLTNGIRARHLTSEQNSGVAISLLGSMSNATYRGCDMAASQVPTIPTVANCFHSNAKRFQTNRATRNYVHCRSMNLPTIPTVANCFHSNAKRFQTNPATRNYVHCRSMNLPTIPTVANCFHSKAKRFQTNRATRNYVHCRSMNLWTEYVQDVCGCGSTAPRILNLGTRWIWMVSFKPRPLCPDINKMGEPQNKSGRCGDEKNIFLQLGIESRFLSRPDARYRSRGDEDIKMSLIYLSIGSQMAVRLLALRSGRSPFTSRKIPGTHFC
jgi:hypothetical protein